MTDTKPRGLSLADDAAEPIPEAIQRLYDKPQESWGVVEWRELSFFIFEQLALARAEAGAANRSAAASLQLANDSLREQKKGYAARKYLQLIGDHLAAGTLTFQAKPPRKRSGPAKKFTDEFKAFLVAMEHRQGGTRAAAKFLASMQVRRKAGHSRINRLVLMARTKTFENKISAALTWFAEAEAEEAAERQRRIQRQKGIGLGSASSKLR